MSLEKNEPIETPAVKDFSKDAIRDRLNKNKQILADDANAPIRKEKEKQALSQQAIENLGELLTFLDGFSEETYEQIKEKDVPFDELLLQASILVHEDLPEFTSADGKTVEDLQQELTEDVLSFMEELDIDIERLEKIIQSKSVDDVSGVLEEEKTSLDESIVLRESSEAYAKSLEQSIATIWRQKAGQLVEWLSRGVELEEKKVVESGEYTKNLVEADSFKHEVVVEKQTYKAFKKEWIDSLLDNHFDHAEHEFSDLVGKRSRSGGEDELGARLINNICVSQNKETRVAEFQKIISGIDTLKNLLSSKKKQDYTSWNSHISACLRGAFGEAWYVVDFLSVGNWEQSSSNKKLTDDEFLTPYRQKIEKTKQMCQQALEAVEIEKTAHAMFVENQLIEIVEIIDGNKSLEEEEKREVFHNIEFILTGAQGRPQSEFKKPGGSDGSLGYVCNNLYPLVAEDKNGDWLLPVYQKLNEVSLYESICQGSGLIVDARYGTNNGWVTDEILRFWNNQTSGFDSETSQKNRVPTTGGNSEKLVVETQLVEPVNLTINENVFLKAIGTIQLAMNKLQELGMNEGIKTYLGRVANTINEHTAHKADFSDALFFDKREAEIRSLEVQGKIQEWQGLVVQEMKETGKRKKDSISTFIKGGNIVLSSLLEAKIVLDESQKEALKNAIGADKTIAEKNMKILSLETKLEEAQKEIVRSNQLKEEEAKKIVTLKQEAEKAQRNIDALSADKYNLTEDLELKKSENNRLRKKLKDINALAGDSIESAEKINSFFGKDRKRNVVYKIALGDVLEVIKL